MQVSADLSDFTSDFDDTYSESIGETGELDSRQSVVKLVEAEKDFFSVNLYIQMEYCSGDNLFNYIEKRGKPDRKENFEIFR